MLDALLVFFLLLEPPPKSTLFPYTTLFRSIRRGIGRGACRRPPAPAAADGRRSRSRSEEHTSELQSHSDLVCRLLLEKKKTLLQTCSHRNLYQFLLFSRGSRGREERK